MPKSLLEFEQHIRTVHDYPKPGIAFRDITTLLKEGSAFKQCINALFERYQSLRIDKVAGMESRGFIIGAPLAYALGVGFVPLRKPGKLPADTLGKDYQLEYGSDRIEAHIDAIQPGERVLLVDDLIATGGTALASIEVLEALGANILECAFVIDLPDLGGSEKLKATDHKVFSLCEFEGE